MARPLILVTCWRRPLPTFLGERTVLDTLDPAYADRVAQAGGQPLLVSRPADRIPESVEKLIELADGIVLTGGGDVDPTFYGAGRENVEGDDPVADGFEVALLQAARASGLPTLAICRGAQLLAVAHGGSLNQRLPSTEGHGGLDGLTGEQIRAARHDVSLAAGSRLQTVFQRSTIAVNTIHHHHIAAAGELVVSARAPDGVIEAVEPPEPWPCLGVQWHPEKMTEPEQGRLFAWLIARAREERPSSAGVPELVG